MRAPPEYVVYILKKLEAAGYEAYMAGGCVRDALLSRRPNDWDVASSAPPERVIELFPRTVPTGLKHGTVTVLHGGGSAEVTHFRRDGEYTDHRRPDEVFPAKSIEEDLSRRDFTINAMAMDLSLDIIDPFGGQRDLSNRLIRCVGGPRRRFEEDALRMLRAIRFSAQLGFEIEPETLRAIAQMAPLCSALSAERVRDEVLKTLYSPAPERLGDMLRLGLLDAYVEGRPEGIAPPPSLPKYARLPWVCAALERGEYIMSTDSFLSALRVDNRARSLAGRSVEAIKRGGGDWKRLVRDFGEDAVRAAFPGNAALRGVLRSGECCTAKALCISGGELLSLGLRGADIGKALDGLLEHVIDHPEDNRKDILCKLIENKEIEL